MQYFEYIGGILRGDFGTTLTDNRPVIEILLQYGSATLELAIYALFVALLIGIPFGLLAAYKRDRWPDATLRIGAILGLCDADLLRRSAPEARLLGVAERPAGRRAREHPHRTEVRVDREPHRHSTCSMRSVSATALPRATC